MYKHLLQCQKFCSEKKHVEGKKEQSSWVPNSHEVQATSDEWIPAKKPGVGYFQHPGFFRIFITRKCSNGSDRSFLQHPLFPGTTSAPAELIRVAVDVNSITNVSALNQNAFSLIYEEAAEGKETTLTKQTNTKGNYTKLLQNDSRGAFLWLVPLQKVVLYFHFFVFSRFSVIAFCPLIH